VANNDVEVEPWDPIMATMEINGPNETIDLVDEGQPSCVHVAKVDEEEGDLL
jgi:hypothetical protein